jgi:hypothetical protein
MKRAISNAGTIVAILFMVILIAGVVYLAIIFSPKDISEIKSTDYVGKTVRVKGEVKNVLKIGQISGFTIQDETDSIPVSSEELPKEGDTIRVKGILMKDSILGYYIKAY